jgi:phenylpropionate dioxygenase-like ring-hydroxylating dioxygenase large terminal subunit
LVQIKIASNMAEDIRNLWYMAGWEEEIVGAGFLTRTVLGTPMAFFRKAGGDGYVAFADRCPHRFAPLSRGKREGDNVVCGYHGLTFDPQGKCVRSPFSDSVPPGCEVKSFPLVAKDSILWFWPGDPALADPTAIGDFSCMTAGAPLGRGHLRFEANYELLTDNLMDLSHVEFLHTGSFGGGGVMFNGAHSVKHDQDAIWSNWWMANIPPPPWATFLPPEMKVDHWMDMRWQAPASMLLEVGICPTGGGRSQPLIPPLVGPHIITPKTQTSSHYFYGFPKFAGAESTDAVGAAFKEEDQPMIEAVQRNMADLDFWGKRPAILKVDTGAIHARRRLMKLRRDEAKGLGERTVGEAVESE